MHGQLSVPAGVGRDATDCQLSVPARVGRDATDAAGCQITLSLHARLEPGNYPRSCTVQETAHQ